MDQPLSLGVIARASGADLLATRTLTPAQIKVLRAIADCRTEAMGGHRDRCNRCDFEHTFWNSCRDRHCPGCGAEARESWLDKRREEVLDVPYFHVFLDHPDVPATNHRAEQAIRPAVVNRKMNDGNRTWRGANDQAVVASLLRTWAQQGRNAIDQCVALLTSSSLQAALTLVR